MMQEKCSLNSINRILVMVSMVVLTIVLIFITGYYIYIKWYNIREKYENVDINQPISRYDQEEQVVGGSSCTFPKIKYPSDMNFRDCQVYFTEDTEACDTAKTNDANNTCKYIFHGWKEFDSAVDAQGNVINYPKKIYTPEKSSEIVNGPLVNKCFKPFRLNTYAEIYEYQNNDLVNHDCKGITGNIENDTNQFGNIKYTSFNFFNNTNPSVNYNNIINSICSVKYNTFQQLRNKSFFRFELDNANRILAIKKFSFNEAQNKLEEDTSFSAEKFTSSSAYGLEFHAGNTFKIFKTTNYPNKNVTIYKFKYNYLCSDNQVTEFTIHSSTLKIVDILELGTSGQVDTKTTTIDVSEIRDIAWNIYKNTVPNNKRDFKPDIVNALDAKILAIKQSIDTSYASKLSNLDTEISNIENAKLNAEKSVSEYDSSFANIITTTRTANIFANISSGAFVNQKSIPVIDNVRIINRITGEIVAPKSIDYQYHYYELTDTSNDAYQMTIQSATECEVLIVGGGGSGGVRYGGGGGAGALIYRGPNDKHLFKVGTYILKVGLGGAGVTGERRGPYPQHADGNNGGDSYIRLYGADVFLAKGGSGGSGYPNASQTGGSSGGSAGSYNAQSAGPTTANIAGERNGVSITGVYGNRGGSDTSGGYRSWWWNGGGGGGAGGPGSNNYAKEGQPDRGGVSGNGGNGLAINITGTTRAFAAGGGGGGNPSNSIRGEGGVVNINGRDEKIGGDGSTGPTTADSGKPNTGSGGGGSGWGGDGWLSNGTSGAGGSGIIILKFRKHIWNIENIMSSLPPETNLACWYKFDDKNNLVKNSVTNRDNLINNGAIFENGNARFNGNSFMTIPSSINIYNIFNNNGITFSVWFKGSRRANNWCRIMDFGDGIETASPSNSVLIAKHGHLNKVVFVIQNSGDDLRYESKNELFDDAWHHLVWSISKDNEWKIYIDGVLEYFDDKVRRAKNIPNINFTKQFLGKSSYPQDGLFNGNIDDFRIYTRVLSDNEAVLMYINEDNYRAPTNIYTLQDKTPEYNITTTYNAIQLEANKFYVYTLYGYMYLQKGRYKFYAYLNLPTNIFYTSEFYIMDPDNTISSVCFIKSVNNRGTKYELYTTKRDVLIPSGGFYKVCFKAYGFNNISSMITTSLNIFVEYSDNVNENIPHVKLQNLPESAVNYLANTYNKTLVSSFSAFRSGADRSPKNTIKKSATNTITNNNDLNMTQFFYYGFDFDAFISKGIYMDVNNITPNTSSSIQIFKNHISNPPIDYFRVNYYNDEKIRKTNEKTTTETKRLIEKGETSKTEEGVTTNADIIKLTRVKNSFTNIDYSQMPASSKPTLKTNQNVSTIFEPPLIVANINNYITIEPFARTMLTADGRLPDGASKSLYIEEFV